MTLQEAQIQAQKLADEHGRVFFASELLNVKPQPDGRDEFEPTGEYFVIGAKESMNDPRPFSTERGGWKWPEKPHVVIEFGDQYIEDQTLTIADLAKQCSLTGSSGHDGGGFGFVLYKN